MQGARDIYDFVKSNLLLVIVLILTVFVMATSWIAKRKLASESDIVRLYYATWCRHSRKFLPTWKKVKEKLENDYPNIYVDDVICNDAEICNKPYIDGFPMVVYYKNGKPNVYNGGRSVNLIMKFIDSHT